MTLAALDNWESLYIKSGQQRSQFMLLYKMAFDEAVELGGMDMNAVAKTYYLFKKLGISKAERREILLKCNGDLTQFESICTLISNLAADEEGRAQGSTKTVMSSQFHSQAETWNPEDEYWNSDDDRVQMETWWADQDTWYGDSGDGWSEHAWHTSDADWHSDEWGLGFHGGPAQRPFYKVPI